MINENFIYLAVLLNLIGSLNYVYNTLIGKAQPNRVTWFLWALAPLIAFAAMLQEGVGISSLMTFMVGFGPLMVFVASFINRKSVWKITKFDLSCGGLSLLGIVLWLFTNEPNLAILFSIIADALALLPTIVKAWKAPETEKPLVFFNGSLSAIITMLTLKSVTFASIGFPLYIFFACALMFILITVKYRPKFSLRITGVNK